MKVAVFVIFAVVATTLVESSPDLRDDHRQGPRYVNRIPPPKPRFRRSPEPVPQGSLTATYEKQSHLPERTNLGYQHKLYENKWGSVNANAGAQKVGGGRWEPAGGVSASFRFRRSPEPEPQGSLTATYEKQGHLPERTNFGYQHKIYENKWGSVDANAGAQKVGGGRWEPAGGVSASFRFRRSPEPEPQGSLTATYEKQGHLPERTNFGYQHKLYENKYGSIDANAGAQKVGGGRWEPAGGVSASFRFRRSPEPEPQGSLTATYEKQGHLPERTNFGYQHKIYENKWGSVDANAGAQKVGGGRWEPAGGVSASFRFRRSPEPEPQGSLTATYEKQGHLPERTNFGYQHKLYENKYGSIDANAGAQKVGGGRWEPAGGVSASFRFRRSPEPEPQGSLTATYEKQGHLPERTNFGYQHKLYENKYGSIDANAGAQKVGGGRWEPAGGVSASFRFRRSPEPEPQGSLTATYEKQGHLPERTNFGYQHKIYENKWGSVDANAGAQKVGGGRWEPAGGVSASFRFRRSPEPEPQGSLTATYEKQGHLPERTNFGYQHKLYENKYGSIDANAGAQKVGGGRWEPAGGLSASFRFRRSPEPEPQGSLTATYEKQSHFPERTNLGYQHRLYENKWGSIDANAGAQKIGGGRWEPAGGISGSFRFRRSVEDSQPEETFESEE